MAREFRIVQLSDCHVSADPGALYRGIHARRAFSSVLETAKQWQPDLLLVTGDLSEDYSAAAYAFLAEALAASGIPVVTTPGNHDHPALQVDYFPETPLDEPLLVSAGEWQLIVLRSSVEGEIPGALSDSMRAGLACVPDDESRPKLVALHHQPVPVGSRWIDRYPLLDPGQLWSLLDERKDLRAVLWGHIHHAFRARRRGVSLLGAPSTVANSFPFSRRFVPDPAGPACRWLKLGSGGRFSTGILRSAQDSGSTSHRMR